MCIYNYRLSPNVHKILKTDKNTDQNLENINFCLETRTAWHSYCYLLNASAGFLSHSPGCKRLWTAGSLSLSSYPWSSPLRQIWATRPLINPPTHKVSESWALQKWKAKAWRCKPLCKLAGELGHSSSVHRAVLPLPGPPTNNTPQAAPFPETTLALFPEFITRDGVLTALLQQLVFSWRQCWSLWKTHSLQ